MNVTTIVPKSLLARLLAGVFLFSLFIPAFQAQAVLGGTCDDYIGDCKVGTVDYPCKSNTDLPSTPAIIEGGKCGGPCTQDTECVTSVGTPLGWEGAKCTGKAAVAAVSAVSGACITTGGNICTAGTGGAPGTCTGGTASCTGVTCVAGSTNCTGGIKAVLEVPAVNGVCLELPGSTQRLADAAPATTGEGLLTLVDTVTNWIFAIFTVLTVIFVLLAAFQFVTAGGDAEKVGEARQKLIWASVGIIIALASKGLVPIVRSIVGG